MRYQPITCVWEVTMGCNMRCKHCGSSCSEPLPDELTTEQALNLCDQIADLGVKWITLSGGEPLTRKDIPLLVKRLNSNGVDVNIITNGWLLDENLIKELKKSGIATVAISIDGTEAIHDSIRRPDSYSQSRRAFSILKENGIKTGAITTISKQNMDILEDMKTELLSMGVDSWQVQLGLPMGNLKERPDWLLEPEQMDDVIEFCYKTAKEGKMRIYPADCIGYCTKKEIEIKQISFGTNNVKLWDGCNAGVRGFGILQNGDILGCTSIRSEEYIEGNILKRSLRDIWEDENTFLWRRNITKSQLSGECGKCVYGSKCLGGCPNTRLTMAGSIYGENEYCSYNVSLKKLMVKYANEKDFELLYALSQGMIKERKYQEATYALERVIELRSDFKEAYLAKGYCDYMCGNYEECQRVNEKALEIDPDNAYALKGYAIAIYKMGNKAEGLKQIRRAADLTGWKDMDIINDLRTMEQM